MRAQFAITNWIPFESQIYPTNVICMPEISYKRGSRVEGKSGHSGCGTAIRCERRKITISFFPIKLLHSISELIKLPIKAALIGSSSASSPMSRASASICLSKFSGPSRGGTSRPRKELSTERVNVNENLIVRDQLCRIWQSIHPFHCRLSLRRKILFFQPLL